MTQKKRKKFDHSEENYQKLLQQYHESNETLHEFILSCLKNEEIETSDMNTLYQRLSTDTARYSYALVDVSDERFLRFGFYETSKKECENTPIFIIQCTNELRHHETELLHMLERFSRQLVHYIAHTNNTDAAILLSEEKNSKKCTKRNQTAFLEAWQPSNPIFH